MAADAPTNTLLLFHHARAYLLELARFPAFAVPILTLPALFYLLFGASTGGREASGAVLVSYCAFAVLGVVLFQFGVGVAGDRESPWERFVRTLPVGPGPRLGARVVTALAFASLACLPVVAAGAFASDAPVGALRWGAVAGVLAMGGGAFAFLGVTLGYWMDPRSAVPTTNLLYLILAYAGGLFQAPGRLPGYVEPISRLLPTGLWRELLTDAAAGRSLDATAAAGLAAWTALFAMAAVAGYRRDEGIQYR